MGIETTYRGYTIRFSENEDKWNCYEAKVSHASLAKVKAKIDKLHLAMRKAAAFDCLAIPGYGTDDPAKITEARVIDYRLKRERNRGLWAKPDGPEFFDTHTVAIMSVRGLNSTAGRSWIEIEKLAPIGPETEAALEVVRARYAEAQAAEKALREAWAAVPRLTFEDVKALAEAADARLDEDD